MARHRGSAPPLSSLNNWHNDGALAPRWVPRCFNADDVALADALHTASPKLSLRL